MIQLVCNRTFGYVMPLSPVLVSHNANGIYMVPLYSLGHNNENEIQHDSLVMLHHWQWCWHHMMPMASKKAPLHSLCQDDQNGEQCGFLVM